MSRDGDLATGLSAVEKSVAGPGNVKRNCRITTVATPIMLSDRIRSCKFIKIERGHFFQCFFFGFGINNLLNATDFQMKLNAMLTLSRYPFVARIIS